MPSLRPRTPPAASLKAAIDDTISTELGESGSINEAISSGADSAINSSLNSGGKINQAIADATDGLLDQATADGLYATKGDLEGLVTGDGIKETVNTAIKENLTQQDGELNTAINNAVSTAKDEISASLDGYATDEEVTGAIAAATGALETQIADKVSKGDMNTAITEATSGLLDKTDADGLYATKGELQSANTNITGLQESVNELDGRLDTAETEIDKLQTSLGNKADVSSVTDLSDKVSGLETSLGDKANASDVYSKEVADSTFLSKEDAANSYVSKDDLTNIKNDISTSLDNKFVSQNELDNTVQETITNQLGDTVSSAVSEEIKDQTAQLEQTVTENVKSSLDETFATDAELSAAKEELSGQITSATNGLSGKIDAITQEGGAIDTAVSEATESLQGNIDGVSEKVDGLSGRLDTAEENISDLQTDMSAAKEDIAGLQTDVKNQGDRLTAAEGNITDLSNALDTTEKEIDGLQSDMTAVKGDISTIKGDMTTVKNDLGSLTDTVNNLDSTYATDEELKNAADTLQNNIDKVSGDLSATNEKVSGLEESLNDKADTDYVDEQLASKADVSDVTELEGTLAETNQNVSDLSGKLNETDEKVSAIDGELDKTNAAVAGNTSAIASNTEAISDLESNKADKSELETAKNDLSGQITSAKEELSDNITATENKLQSNIDTAKSELEQDIADSVTESKNYTDQQFQAGKDYTDEQLDAVEQEIFDSVYTKEDADNKFVTNDNLADTVQTAIDTSIGDRVENAINSTVGDLSQLGTGNKNHTNGTDNAPETIVEAIQNIDQSLGTIHGLADKLGDRHQGNLAQGTTVEEHLTSLDSAIGNRDKYTNANGSNNYLATAGADISSAISEIASNIGTAEDLGAEQNKVSADNTVNQNIAAINSAIGNTSKLANTHYISGATNLTDAVAGLDSQIHNLDSRYYQLSSDIDNLRDDFNAGMATMSALTALVPNARATGNTQLSFGTGMYEGEAAMALGGFHWVDDNILLNVGAAWGSADTAYRMGVTYSW